MNSTRAQAAAIAIREKQRSIASLRQASNLASQLERSLLMLESLTLEFKAYGLSSQFHQMYARITQLQGDLAYVANQIMEMQLARNAPVVPAPVVPAA